MKKLIVLSTIIFAASSAFAQTAKPAKTKVANETVQSEAAKQKSSDIKSAGANNPVGKNGGSAATGTTNKAGSSKPAPASTNQVKATMKNADKSSNTGK